MPEKSGVFPDLRSPAENRRDAFGGRKWLIALGAAADRDVVIQLLYFPGCPHVDAARRQLSRALGTLANPPQVIEVDVTDPSTPPQLRSWGSPTILVDGADVALGIPTGRSCRIYPGSEIDGVPPLATIEAALRRR